MKPVRLVQSVLDMLVDTLPQLFLVAVSHRRGQNHECAWSFPGELVGDADYCCFLDSGVGGEDGFDVCGYNLVSLREW